MRWVRAAVVAAMVLKGAALAVWWSGGLAWAQRAGEATDAEEAGVAPDLFQKSRGFREMLEAIRVRGEELDRREEAVAARESAVAALEQALMGQLGRGAGAPPLPGAATGPCSPAVTKVYASMRPDEAALIFDRLDDATARTIFGCMREQQIGAILAAMRPERAVALTKVMTGGS